MMLYHGSPKKLPYIRKYKAASKVNITVPEGELLEAIYLTPIFEVALAMGARPKGVTVMDKTKVSRTIAFENPELFKPSKPVYIYAINISAIPKQNIRQVDDEQYAVVGIDKIKPEIRQKREAGEVFEYFRQVDFKSVKPKL